MGSMLFLAVIIIIVSGLIAYIGDLVGRKMGRKRLTLFGLRPRHTAIIISVAMGMFIAILTLAATMAVNQQIRESFFTPISDLKAKLRTMQANVAQADTEMAATNAELARVKAQYEQTAQQLAQSDRQLLFSRAQRQRIKVELAKAQRDLGVKKQLLNDKQHELEDVRRRLLFAQAEYRNIQKELASASDRLQQTAQELIKRRDEVERLTQERDDLETRVTKLNERVELLTQLALVSFSPLSFTSGQEIVSGEMPVVHTANERIAYLTRLMAVAERLIRQRSPEMSKDAPALIFLGGDEEHYKRVEVDEAIKALAERIAGLGEGYPVIIRLAPVNNVPVNGPALIAVQSVELETSTTVFQAGDEIARMDLTVSDGMTTAEILGRLAEDLLSVRVPETLRAKGVMMITRRFDSRQPEVMPEVTLSRVPWSNLLTIAQQTSAKRGKVRVLVTARTPVTRYGPVDISFTVIDGGK